MDQAQGASSRPKKGMFWAGCTVSALPVPMLLFSGVMKLMKPPDLAEGFGQLGWPISLAVPLGVIEIACTVIYIVPRTAALGAVLLTGYFGGAIATHTRVEDGNWWGALLLGILVWLGLWLRDARIRAVLPLR